VHDVYVDKGRFLSNTDVNRGARVAVIGSEIAETLFPHVDPLDKEIMIDGLRFRVIGVIERKGKFLGMNRDQVILLPLGSTGKRDAFFNFLLADVKAVSANQMDVAVDQVREILRRQRKLKFLVKDNFMIFSQDTLTDLYKQITGGIYMVMIAISSIGLVVGGVGVMNIMLVSVTERTREIGVRKALGAKKRDIRWQFLTEAMTLTATGGILGILIGGGVAWLVNAFSPFPAVLQPFWVVAAFGTSLVVGLTFGLWPAVKAARLDPIEALRYE
jgi:putative ABC transport system permease protein